MADVVAEPKQTTAKETIPQDVDAKLKRGRDGLGEVVARRQLGIKFTNNNHFAEINEDGSKVVDVSTATVALGGTKDDHRVRRSHDIVSPMIGRKISSAMEREPEWESTSVANDMSDYAAARIGMRLARAGYEPWGFPPAEEKSLWFAMVTEEAFGRAGWNPNVGPFIDVSVHPEADVEDAEGNKPYAGQPDPENPVYRGRGEIGVTIYSGLEVLWEPGVDFEDSRWYAVEHVRSIEELEAEPGFIKLATEKLRADAQTATDKRSTAREKKGSNLCVTTEYFERPCPKYPRGRWQTFANGRKIFKDEDYPYTDAEGNVVDRPCLRRLIYDIDGSNDRAKGLVQKVIDEVRGYDQAINKQAEYAQIGLVAQILAAEGVLLTDPTDEPGLVVEYDRTLANGEKPEWRENITFPSELFTMEERAKQRFSEITFDEDIRLQYRGETSGEAMELGLASWRRFIDRFDRFRSGLMSDCLVLAQRNYGADRLMKFRGPTGWEPVGDFQGADIRNQTDVVVKQSATQMMSRAQVEQRIMQLVQTFPGAFKPEVVIEALSSATPEKLIQGYEEDVGRAHRIIEQLRNGTFWAQPLRPALPGEEVLEEVGGRPMVPGWLPRPFDSLPIYKTALENWMKTDDWDRSPRQTKDASLFYYQKLIDLETAAQVREEQVQSQVAEEQGLANAGREPGPKPSPSLPGGSPQVGGGNGETPVEANAEPEPTAA